MNCSSGEIIFWLIVFFFFYKFLVTFGDIDFGLQNVAFENGVFNSGRRTECLFFKKKSARKMVVSFI